MEPQRRRLLRDETHPPTRRDRVIVLLVSLSFFVLLIPLAHPFHASLVGWIVMLTVIGLPVVTINVLLPFSRWEQKPPTDGSPSHQKGSHEESGGELEWGVSDRGAKHLRARGGSRRRIKTVEGTSLRCEQQASGLLLNARPLLTVHLLQDGLVHLETDVQQFLITGATYWEMVFGNEGPTPMQAGLLLARLDELTDLLQAIVVGEAKPRAEQAQE